MFRELEREAQRLSGPQEIRLDFLLDQDGYLDRQCPECQGDFKVAFEDWSRKISRGCVLSLLWSRTWC